MQRAIHGRKLAFLASAILITAMRTAAQGVMTPAPAPLAAVGPSPSPTPAPAESSMSAAAEPAEPYDPLSAGFWPTPRMIDGILRRAAVEAGQRYQLTPDQQGRIEDRMLNRWQGFLNENRAELQPLVNEYIETRLAPNPPTADEVSAWAARATPAFQHLRENLEAGEKEVRELLTPAQQAKFDVERLKRYVGMEAAAGKLKRWSVGDFKQEEWWTAPGAEPANKEAQAKKAEQAAKKAEAAAKAAANASGTPRPTPVPVNEPLPPRLKKELSAWEKYTADFCDRYQLDRSQRNAAESILNEMLDRAHEHSHIYRDRIAALELKISKPSPGDDVASFNRELETLYAPIDRMYAELQDRLNRLPTTGQRRQIERKAP